MKRLASALSVRVAQKVPLGPKTRAHSPMRWASPVLGMPLLQPAWRMTSMPLLAAYATWGWISAVPALMSNSIRTSLPWPLAELSTALSMSELAT